MLGLLLYQFKDFSSFYTSAVMLIDNPARGLLQLVDLGEQLSGERVEESRGKLEGGQTSMIESSRVTGV